MAENTQDSAPEMPQPTPVFDVTFQHLYTGQVFPQLWMFLYAGIAFFIGALLPWRGGASGEWTAPGFMQAVLLVFSSACIIGGLIGLKGRRPAFVAVMFTEFVAIIFLVLTYKGISDDRGDLRIAQLDEIKAAANAAPTTAENEALNAQWYALRDAPDWGLKDIFVGPFSALKSADDVGRQAYEQAWGTFGSGFFLTGATAIFVFFFMIFTIFGATKAGKKKKEAEAAERATRRAAPRGKAGSGDKKDDGAES